MAVELILRHHTRFYEPTTALLCDTAVKAGEFEFSVKRCG